MTVKVGINGFGRIGRLVFRILRENPDVEIVQINDVGGDASILAHLVNFDSIHGRWSHEAIADGDYMQTGGMRTLCTENREIADTDWSGCDYVIEATGKMKKKALLQAYLDQGVKRVVISAPMKEEGVPNIVVGVNEQDFNPDLHRLLTAASCTTNCLAPVVKVIHENLGIKHGSITTIHSATASQFIQDRPHEDLRRARATMASMIPTTTGAAAAITRIFPELEGKLDGQAVRVPLDKVSLTDCVFEVAKPTSVAEVNGLLKRAAETDLKDILGYEERPLVSIDFKTDSRSSIVDAPSTMVIDGTQVKIYAWYDNEWGYSNRISELLLKIAAMDR